MLWLVASRQNISEADFVNISITSWIISVFDYDFWMANVFIFDFRIPIVDCLGSSAVRATALYVDKDSRRSRDRIPPGAPRNLDLLNKRKIKC